MRKTDRFAGVDVEGIMETARSLDPEKASDDELIRLVFAFDSEEIEVSGDLTARAMATFSLRSRGYTLSGEPGEVEIRDPDGEPITWEDVSE